MSKLLAAVRAGTIKFPVSEQGADYQHRILLRAYMRAYNGGGMFGYDTRTLHANEPELFAYLARLERFKPEQPLRFEAVANSTCHGFKATRGDRTAEVLRSYPGDWFVYATIGGRVCKARSDEKRPMSYVAAMRVAHQWLNDKLTFEVWS